MRAELTSGELLVMTAPTPLHQGVAGEMVVVLRAYARKGQAGRVFIPPSTCTCRAATLSNQMSSSSLENESGIQDAIRGPISLAVEVVSPDTLDGKQYAPAGGFTAGTVVRSPRLSDFTLSVDEVFAPA